MPKVAANGIAINYRIDGREGAPWVTFSNSLATNLSLWNAQAEILAPEFRILRYDQRGHGGTDAPEGGYSFDLLVADVVALWDALDIERSHFVGLSMGGTTGLGLALDHPDRLISLIACDFRCDAPAEFVAAWEPRIELARTKGMDALADPTTERWFNEDFRNARPDIVDRVKEMIRATPAAGFIGCAIALQNTGYRDRLGEIGVPTLFIAGAQDVAAPADYIDELHRTVPGSQYAFIDPAGHISNIENPEQFNHALSHYLAAQ